METERMKLTSLEELVDEVWGKKGTAKRDEMEAHLDEQEREYFGRKMSDQAGQLQVSLA